MMLWLWLYSAGVGRTGCYMVVDSMLQRMQEDDTIDVIGNVTCLRMQRNYMVQVISSDLCSNPGPKIRSAHLSGSETDTHVMGSTKNLTGSA